MEKSATVNVSADKVCSGLNLFVEGFFFIGFDSKTGLAKISAAKNKATANRAFIRSMIILFTLTKLVKHPRKFLTLSSEIQ